jgi:hypothetical protein
MEDVPALVEDPYVGGFRDAELKSGYADYLTSDESSCVGDPRGQTIGFARRPASPACPIRHPTANWESQAPGRRPEHGRNPADLAGVIRA